MGGWRGQTNFGFRDESLNAKNYFADEKGAEQMRRYMVNFQGPIAKGGQSERLVRRQQRLRLRTINALSPTGGSMAGLAETPSAAMNFMTRSTPDGGRPPAANRYCAQNDRDNLGVGDFDLPERAYATDNSTDTVRVRATNVSARRSSASSGFH